MVTASYAGVSNQCSLVIGEKTNLVVAVKRCFHEAKMD